ncbi:hypothetical protein D8B22_02845 [Verminephrobacter aporrectodeae subsp. tuberculatae]|nr:hypothetical protein [Verminephrobacter aporrectodeae subsp. tuberculatae]MCW8168089.1 hypothetical protein [Verminephrobacter aporrectodeae subsp. tuberculatae]
MTSGGEHATMGLAAVAHRLQNAVLGDLVAQIGQIVDLPGLNHAGLTQGTVADIAMLGRCMGDDHIGLGRLAQGMALVPLLSADRPLPGLAQ